MRYLNTRRARRDLWVAFLSPRASGGLASNIDDRRYGSSRKFNVKNIEPQTFLYGNDGASRNKPLFCKH